MAEALIDGFKAELYLTPKPGLVDLLNCGSHPDLSLLLMSRSIVLLRIYLHELCVALATGADYPELIDIGWRAEGRMLTQLGTNAHRGGIFLAGLLLTACRRADPRDLKAFRQTLKTEAERFFRLSSLDQSHGQQIRERFQVGGIVSEACLGLPALFEQALPLLLQSAEQPQLADRAYLAYLAMARLMLQVDDTTSLYRCGEQGLNMLREAGGELEKTILAGENPIPLLLKLDQLFCAMNLTMGGVADLLGVSFGYASYLARASQ
jgi:triphosphoribosyl-dephospho-CoA synthase